jgi:predicted TIM-barrel fold metal-dependent hydrolase
MKKIKTLQDFMVHRTLYHALQHNLVVQIHAGFQAGRRNIINHSDPKLLNSLFVQYKKLRFVVLHISLPFTYDLACTVKNFPNLSMDFSWADQLSSSIACRVMNEMLEFLPAHKIIGFGSDNAVVEDALGESIVCRRMISRVLTGKIEDGYFSEEEAIVLAEKVLFQNAIDCFNLKIP